MKHDDIAAVIQICERNDEKGAQFDTIDSSWFSYLPDNVLSLILEKFSQQVHTIRLVRKRVTSSLLPSPHFFLSSSSPSVPSRSSPIPFFRVAVFGPMVPFSLAFPRSHTYTHSRYMTASASPKLMMSSI